MASFNSRVALAVGGFVLVVVGVGAVALGTRGASHGSDPVSLNGPSSWLVSPSGGTAALLPTASGSPSRSASPAASASARRSSGPTGNPYAADAVLDDPTADPGPDPIFVRDADLRRTETYASRFSKPGDQVLAAGTYAFQYDVTTHALKTQLAARKAKLATATGIAIYLTGGAALSDTDLSTLQTVGRDLALPNLSRLYVYNLKTIQGGKQCVLYLPDVRTIAHDAFRRNQGLTKVVLPRATTIDDYAFDDATSLQYFNAPQVLRLGRNGLNDSGALVSVNFPKLQYLGINSINGLLTGLRLPALTTVDKSAISRFGNLRWLYAPRLSSLLDDAVTDNPQLLSVYLPNATQLNARALRGNTALRQIILGDHPPQQKADVFADSDRATIYHTGSTGAWTGFVPAGNPSLPVRARP